MNNNTDKMFDAVEKVKNKGLEKGSEVWVSEDKLPVAKKDVEKFQEIEKMFEQARVMTSQIKNPVVKKLMQAVLIPLAVVIDFTRPKVKYK